MKLHSGRMWAATAAFLACASCSEEIVIRPVREGIGGTVAGTVRVAGAPVEGTIWVESAERSHGIDSSWPKTLLRAGSRADGSFLVEVPPGQYRLGVDLPNLRGGGLPDEAAGAYWKRNGIVRYWQHSDTLMVAEGTALDSLDLDFGRLALRLHVPEEWLGWRAFVQLLRQEGPRSWWRFDAAAWTEITAPAVDLTFEPLADGEYRAQLLMHYLDPDSKELRLLGLWLPDALVEEDAESIVVDANSTTSHELTVTPERFTVRGSVDGVWLSLELGSPYVVFFTADSVRVGEARCDALGNFERTFWARAPIKVAVDDNGRLRWFGGTRFDNATLFEPPPDGELTGLRFNDSAIEARLHGIGDTTHEPVQLLLVESGGAYVKSIYLRDRQDQRAVVPFLQPGSYRLQISPGSFLESDWVAQWYDRANDETHSTIIEVSHEGELVAVDVTLEAGAQIQGTVRNPAGRPRTSFGLYLTGVDSNSILGGLQQEDEDGQYVLRGVPPGNYRVGAHRYWYREANDVSDLPAETRWFRDRTNWADADVITITGVDTVSAIDFTVP